MFLPHFFRLYFHSFNFGESCSLQGFPAEIHFANLRQKELTTEKMRGVMVSTGLSARRLFPIMLALLSDVVVLLPFKVAHAKAFKGNLVKARDVIHGDSDTKFLHRGTLPSLRGQIYC